MHLALRACLPLAFVVTACEERSGPPPRPPEVPIEDNPPPPVPTSGPLARDEDGPAAAPVPTAGRRAVGSAPGESKLTPEQCNQLLDKFIDLVAVSQGLETKDLDKARPQLRMAIAGNPNFKNAQDACLKQNNQAQFDCAMMSTSLEGWQSCLK